jgi:hypothetical protein
MPAPLDYAQTVSFPKTLALPALIGGLISGLLGPALAMFFDRSFGPPGPHRKMLVLLVICGPIAVSFAFSLVVMLTLPKASRPRDRTFAKVGVVASVAWGLLFALFFVVIIV